MMELLKSNHPLEILEVRAKICVHSKDSSMDPVGACVWYERK